MKYPSRVVISILLVCVFLSSVTSCTTYKNVPYFMDFSDSAAPTTVKTITYQDPVIKTDDILNINVQTLDTDADLLFARANAISPTVGASSMGNILGNQSVSGYLVDKSGNVELPLIGKVYLQGLTTGIARDTIRNRVNLLYKNPSVDVRFSNFRITLMGEIARPATYTIPNERVSIIDALGMAGDMTIFGKRENVLLIRDSANQKQLVRLNLNKKDVISSPYFYLRQNDIVYVEPNKYKVASVDAVRNRNITIASAVLSVVLVALTRIR
ncbi:polysaccharide biosynthesis/export family protein [Foetidibacter luteolus]|uniref:polysaccharide biosynthesis/export family protein n=1 Tax=Foetidibacter luteolus TaxID=2608880 RepID=UPI00129BED5D|nr:polysaccharide biosynthesis/export family protein [Foetidibacter luteolus]